MWVRWRFPRGNRIVEERVGIEDAHEGALEQVRRLLGWGAKPELKWRGKVMLQEVDRVGSSRRADHCSNILGLYTMVRPNYSIMHPETNSLVIRQLRKRDVRYSKPFHLSLISLLASILFSKSNYRPRAPDTTLLNWSKTSLVHPVPGGTALIPGRFSGVTRTGPPTWRASLTLGCFGYLTTPCAAHCRPAFAFLNKVSALLNRENTATLNLLPDRSNILDCA